MKIKIGNKIYDGIDQPIMVILEGQDRENIKNMLPEARKYCVFPEGVPKEEIMKWMKLDDDEEHRTLYYGDPSKPDIILKT